MDGEIGWFAVIDEEHAVPIAAEGKVADEQAAAPQTIGARACGNILDFLNLLNLVERKGVAVEWGVDRDNPVFYYRGKGRGVKGKKDRKHADEHCRDQGGGDHSDHLCLRVAQIDGEADAETLFHINARIVRIIVKAVQPVDVVIRKYGAVGKGEIAVLRVAHTLVGEKDGAEHND